MQLLQIPSEIFHADETEEKLMIYMKEKNLIKEKVIGKYGFPKISDVMIRAFQEGYYSFEPLRGRDINVMLVVRKKEEGLEIGYFGGKRSQNKEKLTCRAAMAQLRLESNKTFNDLLIKGYMQKLNRRFYAIEEFPELMKDYSTLQDVYFWFV